MGIMQFNPNNGSIRLEELERFCREIRGNGGDDYTQVFVRSDDGIVYNIHRWRPDHSMGPVLEISVPPGS